MKPITLFLLIFMSFLQLKQLSVAAGSNSMSRSSSRYRSRLRSRGRTAQIASNGTQNVPSHTELGSASTSSSSSTTISRSSERPAVITGDGSQDFPPYIGTPRFMTDERFYIKVRMADRSIFGSHFFQYPPALIPLWMQPGMDLRVQMPCAAFVRVRRHHLHAQVIHPLNRPQGHNPNARGGLRATESPQGPVYAELNMGNGTLFIADEFHVYLPAQPRYDPAGREDLRNYTPDNHLYILLPFGPIYSSVLKVHSMQAADPQDENLNYHNGTVHA